MLYFGGLTFCATNPKLYLKIPNAVAAQRIAEAVLQKYKILSDNVGKLAKDRGLLVLGHIVIIVGSRHILMWDMNREGMLADKPYLVDEKRE